MTISFVLLEASLITISIWVVNLSFTTSLSFNKISLVCYKISIFPESKLTRSMLLAILELTFINATVLRLQNSVAFKFTIQKVSFVFFVFICQFSFSTSLIFIKFAFILWSRGWCLFTCTMFFTLFKIPFIFAISNKISQLSMTMKLIIFKLSNIMQSTLNCEFTLSIFLIFFELPFILDFPFFCFKGSFYKCIILKSTSKLIFIRKPKLTEFSTFFAILHSTFKFWPISIVYCSLNEKSILKSSIVKINPTFVFEMPFSLSMRLTELIELPFIIAILELLCIFND